MSKYGLLLLALFLSGCATAGSIERQKETYSPLEVTLIDMSKKITSYYARQEKMVPPGFDGSEFIAVLDQIYPDKKKVDLIKTNYRVEAREVGGDYSVVLCDPESGRKLLEDFGCTLTRVDVRYWDKEALVSCEFEKDLTQFCR